MTGPDPETRPRGLTLDSRHIAREAQERSLRHRGERGRLVALTATAVGADGSYTYRSVRVWVASSPDRHVPRGRHCL